jgi:hypothetical protein
MGKLIERCVGIDIGKLKMRFSAATRLQLGCGRSYWHAKGNTQEQVHQSDLSRLRVFGDIPIFEHPELFSERVRPFKLAGH